MTCYDQSLDAQPERLRPGHFGAGIDRKPHATTTHRLMYAILDDVARIFAHSRGSSRRNPLAREAARWLLATDLSWPFSFLRICEGLDLPPDRTRRVLQYGRCDLSHSARTLRAIGL